jgi:hypothetical protein
LNKELSAGRSLDKVKPQGIEIAALPVTGLGVALRTDDVRGPGAVAGRPGNNDP